MIVEGLLRGVRRAQASVTLDNVNLSTEFAGGQPRAIQMVGGKFATYEALYRTQPWVYSTWNRLARGLSRLPLPIYVDGGRPGERTRIREGSLYDLLRRPWTTMSAGAIQPGNTVLLIQAVLLQSMVHGFAVFLKDYSRPGGGRSIVPTGLIPTSSYNWRPVFEGNVLAYWQLRTAKGVLSVLPEEVWVFAPWGVGLGGLPSSPMEALRTTLMAEDATQRAVIQRFEKGARPVGFIGFEGMVKNLPELRQQATEVYSGVDNFYKIAMFDQNAKWQEMGSSFVDSELVNLRKLNREEVAAVGNMPQPSVGILDRATFSNVTEQHLMEYMDTYGPPAALFEESFQGQVIDPEPAWQGNYIEFNFREVLRGDPIREQESLVKAAGRPILTANEARARVNLVPLDDPGADQLAMPQNMATGGQDANANLP